MCYEVCSIFPDIGVLQYDKCMAKCISLVLSNKKKQPLECIKFHRSRLLGLYIIVHLRWIYITWSIWPIEWVNLFLVFYIVSCALVCLFLSQVQILMNYLKRNYRPILLWPLGWCAVDFIFQIHLLYKHCLFKGLCFGFCMRFACIPSLLSKF